jgi:hypothetical protein
VVSLLLAFPPISYVHSSSPPFVLQALPILCSRLGHWNFSNLPNPSSRTMVMESTPSVQGLSLHLSRGAEEDHEKPQWEWMISGPTYLLLMQMVLSSDCLSNFTCVRFGVTSSVEPFASSKNIFFNIPKGTR